MPPDVAEIVTTVADVTGLVVMTNPTVVAPAGTVTLAGTARQGYNLQLTRYNERADARLGWSTHHERDGYRVEANAVARGAASSVGGVEERSRPMTILGLR
jgi:hypothetical protein